MGKNKNKNKLSIGAKLLTYKERQKNRQQDGQTGKIMFKADTFKVKTALVKICPKY